MEYLRPAESFTCTEPLAEICTIIATCSESLMDSRGVTVISVLCVTKEVGLRCCTIFAELLMDSDFKLQVELVPDSDAESSVNK